MKLSLSLKIYICYLSLLFCVFFVSNWLWSIDPSQNGKRRQDYIIYESKKDIKNKLLSIVRNDTSLIYRVYYKESLEISEKLDTIFGINEIYSKDNNTMISFEYDSINEYKTRIFIDFISINKKNEDVWRSYYYTFSNISFNDMQRTKNIFEQCILSKLGKYEKTEAQSYCIWYSNLYFRNQWWIISICLILIIAFDIFYDKIKKIQIRLKARYVIFMVSEFFILLVEYIFIRHMT